MKHKLIVSAILSVAFGLPTFAQNTRDINYAGEDLQSWGTNKKEKYDVAVRLNDPILSGAKITGVEIPAVVSEGTDNWSVWLASELTLENKVNVADVKTVTCTPTDGKVVVTFDEGYTLPETGVYVGYSFEVTDLTDATRAPISVGSSTNTEACYVHSSRTYMKWQALNKGTALNYTIHLEGNFSKEKVSITPLPDYGELAGAEFCPTITFRNTGLEDISSINYSCTINGATIDFSDEYSPALTPSIDKDVAVTAYLGILEEAGTYPWSFTITSINGKKYEASDNTVEGTIYAYPYAPAHHPLMEEYTGTWCGWCPKANITMTGMKAEYGDRFIGVVYHTNDILTISPNPYVTGGGVPGSFIDRGNFVDPYHGTQYEEDAECASYRDGFAIDWEKECAVTAVADLTVDTRWTDDSQSAIEAAATVKFIRPYENADFRMMYILVNDEITGSGRNWAQSNYYSKEHSAENVEKYAGTDLMALVDMDEKIRDISYHDVAILAPDTYGIEGSLPAEIPYLTELTHTKVLALSDAVTTPPEDTRVIDIVQDKSKLTVIASVVDYKTGRVINSRKVRVGESSAGVENVEVETNAPEVWYNLQGLQVDANRATPGIYIIRKGNSTSKRVVR